MKFLHKEINRVKYTYPAEHPNLALVHDALESAICAIESLETIEGHYAAVDAKAQEMMIPQLMDGAATAQDRFDALVVPPAPALFNAFPEEDAKAMDIVEAAGF